MRCIFKISVSGYVVSSVLAKINLSRRRTLHLHLVSFANKLFVTLCLDGFAYRNTPFHIHAFC